MLQVSIFDVCSAPCQILFIGCHVCHFLRLCCTSNVGGYAGNACGFLRNHRTWLRWAGLVALGSCAQLILFPGAKNIAACLCVWLCTRLRLSGSFCTSFGFCTCFCARFAAALCRKRCQQLAARRHGWDSSRRSVSELGVQI